MTHTPPTEQAILTPVPIYVELPDGVTAVKVIARYKAFGTTDWKTIELRKMGNGYGGEVPCLEIGSTTGDLSLLRAGDRRRRRRGRDERLAQRAQQGRHQERALGRAAAPAREATAFAMPRRGRLPSRPSGLPRRKKVAAAKVGAPAATTTASAATGLVCKNGSCETGDKSGGAEPATGKSCETSSDCDAGQKCNSDKVCEGARGHGQEDSG